MRPNMKALGSIPNGSSYFVSLHRMNALFSAECKNPLTSSESTTCQHHFSIIPHSISLGRLISAAFEQEQPPSAIHNCCAMQNSVPTHPQVQKSTSAPAKVEAWKLSPASRATNWCKSPVIRPTLAKNQQFTEPCRCNHIQFTTFSSHFRPQISQRQES